MRVPFCSQNHVTSLITYEKLVSINPEYTGGCFCDWCHKKLLFGSSLYHCNICNYDICRDCVTYGSNPVQEQHAVRGIYGLQNSYQIDYKKASELSAGAKFNPPM